MSRWAAVLAPIGRRLGPFLDLLDARYLPLLAVVAPQAWTVYAWLLRDGAPEAIAVLGGLGYEAVYVGAVAWAERGAGWGAARPPAVAALLFSVAVAVAYYAPALGPIAILHAGFPIVAYAYTVSMHAAQHRDAERVSAAEAERRAADAEQRATAAAQREAAAAQAAHEAAQREAAAAQRAVRAEQEAREWEDACGVWRTRAGEQRTRADALEGRAAQAAHEAAQWRALAEQPPALPAPDPDTTLVQIAGRSYSVRQAAEAAGVAPSTYAERLARARAREEE